MISLGLGRSKLRRFNQGLALSHHRSIEVQVLNLNGRVIRSMTPTILDGEVTVDVTRTPSRMLALTFLDPHQRLSFDKRDPGSAPLNRSRMIRVIDSRLVPGLDEWVDVPVFTGIVVDFEREGAEVRVTAHGKEIQAMGARWSTRNWPKKGHKTTVVRDLLRDTGEYSMRIPHKRASLPDRLTVSRFDHPWKVAVKVTESMSRHLYYNGRGRCIMRNEPSKPVLTIDEHLLSPVTVRRDSEGFVNTIVVRGAKPKGRKRRVTFTATLPKRHDYSPHELRRQGEKHRSAELVENGNIKTKSEAAKRARAIRDRRARTPVEYSFECLPIPHLEELDLVRVRDGHTTVLVRMKQWTLPLGIGGTMGVGSVKRTTRTKQGKGGKGGGGKRFSVRMPA